MNEPGPLESTLWKQRFADAVEALVEGHGTADLVIQVALDAIVEAREQAAQSSGEGWGTTVNVTDCVADRLSGERGARKWTQARLAEEMNLLGFDWNRLTVTQIERSNRRVLLDELIVLAAVFEVAMPDLLDPPDACTLEVLDVEVRPDERVLLLRGGDGQQVAAAGRSLVARLRESRGGS